MLIDSSTLTLFQPLTGSTSGDILSALYGSSTVDTNPLQSLQTAEAGKTADISRTAADPQVKRDLDAFSAAVAKAKTPADLLSHPVVLKVLLTANGLGDQADYTALARKALLSDPAKSTSLVSQLTDTRWKPVAATYLFATKGLTILHASGVLPTLKRAYAEVLWRQSLDTATPGLSNAISFRERASTIKSVDQILGDPTLRTVVTTALGIPQEIAFQDLGAQEKSISSRLDISKFKDSHFVDGLTQRYLLAAQGKSSSAKTGTFDSLAVQAMNLVV